MAEEEKLNEATAVPPLTTPSVDPEKVFGFDGKVSAVERLLLREEESNKEKFKAIGMVGMKGIGKTTLCQLVFNEREVKSYFLPRIWVCLSRSAREDQEPNERKMQIVKRMLESLGANKEILESSDLGKLVYALNLMLRGKRYLIVLDGAEEEDDDWFQDLHSLPPRGKDWSERLAYGLPKGHGGAVIVTSRSERVAEKTVGNKNLCSLSPLSDAKSCWSIFKKSVKEGLAKEREMDAGEVRLKGLITNKEELKKDVKQECAGVPLMAKLLGEVFIRHNREKLKPKSTETETCKEEKDPNIQSQN